jgi:hypothetical protein
VVASNHVDTQLLKCEAVGESVTSLLLDVCMFALNRLLDIFSAFEKKSKPRKNRQMAMCARQLVCFHCSQALEVHIAKGCKLRDFSSQNSKVSGLKLPILQQKELVPAAPTHNTVFSRAP